MVDHSAAKPVLVVDDETVIRTILADVLGSAGFQVTASADGAEAVELLNTREFGVAILDKNLPGELSGLDVLRHVHKVAPFARVIIFTGYPSKESAVQALKSGAFDYLEKPLDHDLLTVQVGRAWDSYALAIEREELFRKYETLFEIVPGIVWFMTEDGVMKRINRAGAAMLGYTPDELLGKPYNVLLSPTDDRNVSQWAFKERRTGQRATRKQVVELRIRSGATKLFEINATGAWDRRSQERGKRFWGTLVVGWDITEHAVLEEQLQQARKMEAIGRLAGGVAHDFNNLLSVILNNAEFLKTDLKGHEHMPDVLEIESAAHRGAELTKQLLAFSRKQVVSHKPTDLRQVAAEVEPLLRRLIGENIVLEIVQDDDLALVQADPSQMEQVIINLAVNARDAMKDGGRLTIQTSNLVLDQEFAGSHLDVTPGDYVMLAVSDTGHGMTPEVREHLFEPFYTTKGIGRGTGLGMATVYGIVMQSGGHISVYSEGKIGTSVKVYLPAIESTVATEAARTPSAAPSVLTGTETILVVEDEDMVRRLARRVLERHGYQVMEASDGTDALQIACKRNIHLLLTDIVMPRMGGAELARAMRERQPNLQVLYMSGYVGNVATRHQILGDGSSFLQKPFTALRLLQSVRRVIDGTA